MVVYLFLAVAVVYLLAKRSWPPTAARDPARPITSDDGA